MGCEMGWADDAEAAVGIFNASITVSKSVAFADQPKAIVD
jgi:hypothetical protein